MSASSSTEHTAEHKSASSPITAFPNPSPAEINHHSNGSVCSSRSTPEHAQGAEAHVHVAAAAEGNEVALAGDIMASSAATGNIATVEEGST